MAALKEMSVSDVNKEAALKLKDEGDLDSHFLFTPSRKSAPARSTRLQLIASGHCCCSLAGNAHFKDKAFLKAAGCYTKAAKKDPTNPVYQSNLAAALIGLSKFDKAIVAAQVRQAMSVQL